MSNHRADVQRQSRFSGRARAVLSLAAVAVLATGFSVKGTFAFWTDAATLSTGSFTSGTLDITLNGQLAGTGQLPGTGNNGGTTTPAPFVLTSMVPSESLAFSFPVANMGTVPLTYTVGATATGDLAPSMQFTVYTGGTATNTPLANGLRSGSCGGTALPTTNNTVFTTTSTAIVPAASARSLAAAPQTPNTESICIVARLNPNADNTTQGKTMSASFVFDAKQVGAP